MEGSKNPHKRKVASVDVDLRVFNMDAVKSACYRLADVGQASIKVNPNDDKYLLIAFSLPSSYSDAEVECFLDEFNTELIDYDLRIKIREETAVSRNLILAYAFADTKLSEE